MSDEKSIIKINVLPEKTTDALLTPGATSIGSAFKDIVEALGHKTLGPLRKFNLVKEKELKDFEEQLNTKINDIPEESRDQSKIGIAFKALEDSKYQLNEEEMREAFSNLISKSLNSDKNKSISPIFSSILANMSVSEARLLKSMYKNGHFQVALSTINVKSNSGASSRRVSGYYLHFFDGPVIQGADLELSLLESANVININEDASFSNQIYKDQYSHFENNLVNRSSFEADLNDDEELNIDHHALTFTPLGKELANILFN